MDRIAAMQAFVKVVDCGSYTAAARALGRHKATVSQQVQQLERLLSAVLLTRTTRRVVPTAEGLALHRRAVDILRLVDEAESSIRTAARSPAGRLRANVPVAIGRHVLVPEIRSFLERHPLLEVELGCTDRLVDLIAEGVDCAIRGGALPDSGLVSRRIGELPFVLCASPRYVQMHGLPQRPEDLMRLHRVGYMSASTGRVEDIRLSREGRTHALAIPARLITNDSGAVLSAGLDGLGIVQIAEYVADPYLATGALVRILPAWQGPSLALNLVAPTARLRTARVQAFMDWTRKVLSRRLALAGVARGDA